MDAQQELKVVCAAFLDTTAELVSKAPAELFGLGDAASAQGGKAEKSVLQADERDAGSNSSTELGQKGGGRRRLPKTGQGPAKGKSSAGYSPDLAQASAKAGSSSWGCHFWGSTAISPVLGDGVAQSDTPTNASPLKARASCALISIFFS